MNSTPSYLWCARALLAGYLAMMATVLLQPEPTLAVDGVSWFGTLVDRIELWPDELSTPTRLEAAMNAALFAPAAALAVLSFPRIGWAEAVAIAFAGSVTVEIAQAALFHARSAEAIDVVANTAGSVLGSTVGAAAKRATAKHSWRGRPPDSRPEANKE